MYGAAHQDLRQMVGSLRTGALASAPESQALLPHWPFVTISRQAGAGGRQVGALLAARLNREETSGHPWQFLDRELVERIAADHNLSTELIDSLERSSHTWISEFFGGLSLSDRAAPSDLSVFRRVVETMRALARAGHVILVGLGGAFITKDMPGGLHVRLIAPLEWRIKNFARLEGISEAQARDRVKLLDRDREAFFAKFFPRQRLDAEAFHLTLNAGALSDERMAQCLEPLVLKRSAVYEHA